MKPLPPHATKPHPTPHPPLRRWMRPHWAASAAWTLLSCASGSAATIDLDDPAWRLRWDNTVKASTLYRLHDANPTLVNTLSAGSPQALNFNAGDDNFRRSGVVSKRLDLLSEFDAVYQQDFGLRVSAAAWSDAAYRGATDAMETPGAAGPGNGQTPYNQFSAATRSLAGKQAELLDAFVFGAWRADDGQKVTVRLGRHALQYGESLFFGDNGIARAQGPVDVMKLQAAPNAQFKEIIRPVPQVSAQWQLNADVSLGGYYQFRWEADRMAPAGSYFSTANTIWGSTLPAFITIPAGPIAGSYVLSPAADHTPSKRGQFGLQLRWRTEASDYGLYAARYHDKSGQLFSVLNLATPAASQWFYAFPEAVTTLGGSLTRTLGDTNLALEASVRHNMPLVNQNVLYPLGTPRPTLATGHTAHLNLSWLSNLPPNAVAREATFVGELAWNRVLSANDPSAELDAGRTRDAAALQFIFSPSYRQALPGLDLSVPVGLRYAVMGRSAITGQGWGPQGTGSLSLGLDGTYAGVWQFSLAYTQFIGKATPFLDFTSLKYASGNALADRSNLALSLRRTF